MAYQAMAEARGERTDYEASRLLVSRLATAEQFVLGVCRCWDAYMDDPDPAALAWRELTPVFTYMNVMSALCAFERAFTALHRHSFRTLRFEAVDSPQVGPDEERLLCALACLQRGDPLASIRVLAASLTHYGVRMLLPPLAHIAAILDLQGHRLPAWRFADLGLGPSVMRTPIAASRDEISSPPQCPVR